MREASFILFDDDGRIHRVVSFDTGGLHVLMGTADDASQFVDMETMEVVSKADMAPEISVDHAVVRLAGLPDGAVVRLHEAAVNAMDGAAVLAAPPSGEHRLVVRAPRHKEFKTILQIP